MATNKDIGFVDDIQEIIDNKPDDCCQGSIKCYNEAIYIVTSRYGVREKDCEVFLMCPECMELYKKDWLGFVSILCEVVPGKKAVEKAKKRGRPRN
jgi:uncharacterized C2H2 Zn-finger protein